MWRIPGVLVRIGICYGFAATLAPFLNWRWLLASILALLTLYASLMLGVPFHNDAGDVETGSLTKESNLARKIDETVFDRFTISKVGSPPPEIADMKPEPKAVPSPGAQVMSAITFSDTPTSHIRTTRGCYQRFLPLPRR